MPIGLPWSPNLDNARASERDELVRAPTGRFDEYAAHPDSAPRRAGVRVTRSAQATLQSGESAERGRAARGTTSRSAHGDWAPAPDRPDPISVLQGEYCVCSGSTRLGHVVRAHELFAHRKPCTRPPVRQPSTRSSIPPSSFLICAVLVRTSLYDPRDAGPICSSPRAASRARNRSLDRCSMLRHRLCHIGDVDGRGSECS